jgi:hypothetical protein
MLTLHSGLENYSLAVFGKAGWKEADIRAMIEKVMIEVNDPSLKGYGQV